MDPPRVQGRALQEAQEDLEDLEDLEVLVAGVSASAGVDPSQ